MRIQPVVFVWKDVDVIDEHGEVRRRKAMVPLPRCRNIAGRQFVEGEEYPLVIQEERSQASQRAYFGGINQAFKNMPEGIKVKFPSKEHLRHWALIETNWCDQTDFICPDEKFMKRMIAFIRKETPYARMTYAPIDGGGFVLSIKIAKSQSKAAMKKPEFERSKKDVLDYLESLTGIPVATLKRESGRST